MKKRHQLLASFLVSSQLLGAITPVFAEEFQVTQESDWSEEDKAQYDKNIESMTFSEPVNMVLQNLKGRSSDIKNNEQLNALMSEFTKVYTHSDNKNKGVHHSDMELLMQGLSKDVYNILRDSINKDGNKARAVRFANELAIGISEGANGYFVLLEDFVDSNKIESADKELNDIWDLILRHKASQGEGGESKLQIVAGKLVNPDSGDKPNTNATDEKVVEPEEDKEKPLEIEVDYTDVVDNKPESIQDNQISFNDRSGSYYEFDAERNTRVRVDYTIKVVDGKDVREEKRTIEAEGLTSLWSDRLESFGAITKGGETKTPDWAVEKAEKKEESTLTLQYSINKDDQFPVYVDTGLFADLDGSAAYDDVYGVLYQIAANIKGGFLVEDSDKLLIIAEGRPVYILEKEDNYTQEEIEGLFEDFNHVELLVSETRIGTNDSLEWQLRTNQEQDVLIDGEEVKLKTTPELRGKRVVLPIVEMMESIGGVVEEEENGVVVRYDGKVVSFENGVNAARIDGELVELNVPVERNEQGVYTASLQPVFVGLGIDAVWDEQESTIYLNKTKRQEMLKEQDSSLEAQKETEEDKEVETEENLPESTDE